MNDFERSDLIMFEDKVQDCVLDKHCNQHDHDGCNEFMHSHPKEYVQQHHVQQEIHCVTARKACKFPPTWPCSESKVTSSDKVADKRQNVACSIGQIMPGTKSEQHIVYAVMDSGCHRSYYAEPYELNYLVPVVLYQTLNIFHRDCKYKQNLIIFAIT